VVEIKIPDKWDRMSENEKIKWIDKYEEEIKSTCQKEEI